MKTYKTRRFCLALMLAVAASALQAQVRLATWEYWIDRQYSGHQSVQTDGSLTHEIDVSNLRTGIHTLEMRVSDSNGRWSSPQLRYFLKTDAILANSHLSKYEYWIDDNAIVQTGTMTGETLQLDIDVAALGKGVHTLVYQIQYDTGRKSSPRLLYFVVPDLEVGADVIAAYEYWFNHGPRTRVEFQPAAPTASLSNAIIAVKDVVPNTLKGYRFDAAEEQAEVDDNVFFGIQVYNGNGRGSEGILSETFPMAVPIPLNMRYLESNGTALTVDAPSDRRMQGMKSETAVGDSLVYTLSAQDVTADFYDADGHRLNASKTLQETGEATYILTAATPCTYMLLYDASNVRTELTASLSVLSTSGVASTTANGAQETARYNVSGQALGGKQRGVNIIRMSDGTVKKVMVK